MEKILASRITGTGTNRRLQYQAAWVGCEPDPTYYDAESYKNAATKLESFHLEYPDAAGPPVRLQQWIRDAADGRISASQPDDNRWEHIARGNQAPKRHKTRHG